MKIALFHDLPTGGALSSLWQFTKHLSQKHEIDFYAISGREKHPIFDLLPFIKHTYIFGQNQPTENFKTPFHRLYSDFYTIFIEPNIEKAIAQQINQNKYQVALVSQSRFIEAPFLLKFLKIPSIYLCPGPPRQYYEYNLRVPANLSLPNKIYEHLIRTIRLRLDRTNTFQATVIASHSYFASEAISMWYNRPSVVTYPGVDPNIFKPSIKKVDQQVFIVGNPEPQKAIDQAILALSRIPLPDRPHLIVASPRLLKANPLKSLAHKLKVKVIWKHKLSLQQMVKYYSESLLTLAVSHREHFGCNVLESLSCATPVIAVREGGFRENIIPGKTGYLVDRDPDQLARAITKLIKQPKLALKLGQAGRKDVLSRWTWPFVTTRLEGLIQKLACA